MGKNTFSEELRSSGSGNKETLAQDLQKPAFGQVFYASFSIKDKYQQSEEEARVIEQIPTEPWIIGVKKVCFP